MMQGSAFAAARGYSNVPHLSAVDMFQNAVKGDSRYEILLDAKINHSPGCTVN